MPPLGLPGGNNYKRCEMTTQEFFAARRRLIESGNKQTVEYVEQMWRDAIASGREQAKEFAGRYYSTPAEDADQPLIVEEK